MLQKFQHARGLVQFKSGLGITCSVSAIVYCTIFNNDSPPPRQFLRTKYLKKKLGKLFIEQIIEFQLRGPGPPGCTVTCTL